ncbi:hypothetical protein [Lachnoclostridium sp. An118]|uniref:hypothetical protein n=1 Tax=Lachnoclostridium sp. An118 TaxID=1965547 RepID=UPI00117ABEFF|nr:hypothetical protein [Lachnoclostridium sp. An118]
MTKKVNMVNVDDSEYPTADREYKDRLFRLVFNNKEDLLSLYNAVAGAQYEDPDELEINTLGNVLYLSMKNDISFLVSGTLNLYEHQSTYNPNMPMRGVLYFARLYGKIIAKNNINIYSSSPRNFPFPQHIVFYNGTKEQPDRTVLRLSDLFERCGEGKTPALECITVMLNINYGHNRALMEKCRRLEEYAIFVDRVRRNLETAGPLEEVLMRTIDDCIRDGILRDILIQQKAEVVQMILETFDKESYEKAVKSEAYEDGYQAGKEFVLKEKVKKKLSRGKTAQEIAEDLEESLETVEELITQLSGTASP